MYVCMYVLICKIHIPQKEKEKKKIKSKPRPPRSLISPIMPHRNLHLEGIPTIPQILRHQHGGLLTDQQGGAISVAADVVGADGEVGAFEVRDAVDVEAVVQDAVLDDGVAVAGGHGAGAETYGWERGWFSLLIRISDEGVWGKCTEEPL